MVLKPLIFKSDDGFAEVRGHARQRNFDAVFLEDSENRPVMDVVECRRLRHFSQASELVPPRKAGKEPDDEEHHSEGGRPSAPKEGTLVA
jgi:hypothetical protein